MDRTAWLVGDHVEAAAKPIDVAPLDGAGVRVPLPIGEPSNAADLELVVRHQAREIHRGRAERDEQTA